MMKPFARIVIFFLMCLPANGLCQAPRQPTTAPARAKFQPPNGKVLVFVDGAHNDPGIRSWRDITRTEPSGFVSWMEEVSDGDLWYFEHQAAPVNHAVLMFLDFKSKWSKVIDGKHDERTDRIGDLIKKSRRPVFVILGHEFDLDGRNDQNQYVKYFRHVHDRWERLRVDNVAYVWHAVTGFGEKAWEVLPWRSLLRLVRGLLLPRR
jgi:hypothetical protein